MTKKIELRYLKAQMRKVPDGGVVVEVGSWIGESALKMAKGINLYCPNAKLFCVDMFSQAYFEATPGLSKIAKKINILATFEKTMVGRPHTTMQISSVDAAKTFKDDSIDFIFIDAEHAYEAVKADIAAWWPKVKVGGIMCGHDYDTKYQDVYRAVKEAFPVHTNSVASIWEVVKQ